MNEHEWTEIIGAIGMFVLLITVVALSIWQFAKTQRAKAVLAREEQYRKLAEAAVASQQNADRQLTELAAHMTDLRDRMSRVERILKEVE